jgi:hypothetical protein
MHALVGIRGSSRLAALVALAGLSWAGALVASTASCDGSGGGGPGGVGGGGGAGGAPGCPDEVAPLFTLRVAAAEGSLPEDLQLQVSWSAGDEPPVQIADEASYGTSADNVVCVRNPAANTGTTVATVGTASGAGGAGGAADPSTTAGTGGGAPADELLCELWTSGPTRVRLEAMGYVPFDETLPPATTDGCDRPVPSEVAVEVVAEEPAEAEE